MIISESDNRVVRAAWIYENPTESHPGPWLSIVSMKYDGTKTKEIRLEKADALRLMSLIQDIPPPPPPPPPPQLLDPEQAPPVALQPSAKLKAIPPLSRCHRCGGCSLFMSEPDEDGKMECIHCLHERGVPLLGIDHVRDGHIISPVGPRSAARPFTHTPPRYITKWGRIRPIPRPSKKEPTDA